MVKVKKSEKKKELKKKIQQAMEREQNVQLYYACIEKAVKRIEKNRIKILYDTKATRLKRSPYDALNDLGVLDIPEKLSLLILEVLDRRSSLSSKVREYLLAIHAEASQYYNESKSE